MTHAHLINALAILADVQKNTAAITISLGGTIDGIVEHGSLYVHDAPAHAINQLLKGGYMLSMGANGMRLEHY